MTAQEETPHLEYREHLATGPLTTVWRCGRFGDQGSVCAKFVSPTTRHRAAALASLATEQRVRQSVVHPGILPLLAVLPGPTSPVLVGPFMPDGSLDRWSGLALPLSRALTVVDQVGSALDALHQAGWVHGDVSAGNVVCDWGAGRVWLADFGAAQRISATREGPRQVPRASWSVAALRDERADRRGDLRAFAALIDGCLPGRRAAATAATLRTALDDRDDPARRAIDASSLARSVTSAEPDADDRQTPPAGPVTVDRLALRLERLDHGLSLAEQAALRVLLRRAEQATVDASVALTGLAVSILGPAEALTVFEETGLAHVLAAGALAAPEAARRCRLAPGPTLLLLDLMAGLHAVERDGPVDARTYQLAPALRALYLGPEDGGSRPVADARRFWAGLRTWLHTSEASDPLDEPEGRGYAELAEVLGTTARHDAQVLARGLSERHGRPPVRVVVDLGAGSGVWGRAVQAAFAGSRLVLLDRPQVLTGAPAPVEPQVLRVGADWRALPLRPRRADVVVLANVCHLEDRTGAARLIETAAALLRNQGRLVVVDVASQDDLAVGPLLQSLHLALRTLRGQVHPAEAYAKWFAQSGLELSERLQLPSGLTALVAHARTR